MINQNEQTSATTGVPQTEIVRIHTGDATATTPTKRVKRKAQAAKVIKGVFNGDILTNNVVMQFFYLMLGAMAVTLLTTTAIRFSTFTADMDCSTLRNEVQLYRERAIRTSEQRTKCSSRSAILEEMKRRGIELNDPHTTPIVLK